MAPKGGTSRSRQRGVWVVQPLSAKKNPLLLHNSREIYQRTCVDCQESYARSLPAKSLYRFDDKAHDKRSFLVIFSNCEE
jgi:hypothetical protein